MTTATATARVLESEAKWNDADPWDDTKAWVSGVSESSIKRRRVGAVPIVMSKRTS